MASHQFEKITAGEEVLAIIVRHNFDSPGPNFFTPPEWPQQLGLLIYGKGKKISPHKHKSLKRETDTFTEVLVLLRGRLKIDLFDSKNNLIQSVILEPGEAILFASGGHALEILEDAKILEVKQGPYIGQEEKEFF
ncbi:MAG: hypothetical protein N3B16_05260 [Candidatus Aminicenantes bacterium]|nr:hypothetical protein [Candidatus Aminicenantes bacterium]